VLHIEAEEKHVHVSYCLLLHVCNMESQNFDQVKFTIYNDTLPWRQGQCYIDVTVDNVNFNFQSSDCVTLDLLTYSDLEALRNKKLGVRRPSPAKSSRQLQAKRYLILTYSVEFDR